MEGFAAPPLRKHVMIRATFPYCTHGEDMMFVFFSCKHGRALQQREGWGQHAQECLKRSQLQHLLVWENHSRCKLHLVPHNYFGGPEDRRTRGPKDRRTRRPEVPGTRGPEDHRAKKTRRPEDQKTRGPEDPTPSHTPGRATPSKKKTGTL